MTNSIEKAALNVAIAFFLALPLTTTQADQFYVAVDGNDQGTGAIDQPFRTIQRAADLAVAGDSIIVREGVYRERVTPMRGGEPGKRIVYSAFPGERVVIKGSEIWQPDWNREGPGLFSASPDAAIFDDRKDHYYDSHNPLLVELASTPWQREGQREIERGFKGTPGITYTCGQVFIDGARLKEVPVKSELVPNCWFYERSTNKVYVHFGDKVPDQHQVELTTRRRIFAPQQRGLGYITVQGFIMEHCGNQYPTNFWRNNANAQRGALGTEAGHHWIIRRNFIRHAKTFAIDAGRVDNETPDHITPHNNLIEQNYIVDNGSAGILSNRSEHLIIRKNVIMRNNVLRFIGLKRWEQAGVKCHQFDHGLIEENYIADNQLTYGVWLDNQFPDSRVSRNVIVNNGRAGVFLELSHYDFDRLLIDHNIIVGNQENPVYIHDASGASFVHNLMADTKPDNEYGQAVYVRQTTTRRRTRTSHHSFFNNLFIDNSVAMDVNYPAFRGGPQRFDGNLYGWNEQPPSFRINSRSEKPSPWSLQEFGRLVSDQLKQNIAVSGSDKAAYAMLTFNQWQQFWKSQQDHKDSKHDTNSQSLNGSEVRYDSATQKLEIVLAEKPRSVPRLDLKPIQSDFFKQKIENEEKVIPGPFQSISQGANVFKVWDGLPILAKNERPAEPWNEDVGLPASERLSLSSPNGHVRIQFSLAGHGGQESAPTYQVFYRGKPVVGKSSLGLKLNEGRDLTGDFRIISSSQRQSHSTWKPICGERSTIVDHYRELKISLAHQQHQSFQLDLFFRCYDSGAAFRYQINDKDKQPFAIQQEATGFSFAEDCTVWATENAQGIHEQRMLSSLDKAVERPLVVRVDEQNFLAIAEAALDDYASMKLRCRPRNPLTLNTVLAGEVNVQGSHQSPWRVIMLGQSAGELLENNDIIRNLNEPCALADTSWIKPGKVLREFTLTTEGGIACVDFAVKHNMQYIEFDAGWYGYEYDDKSDATTVTVDPKRSPGPLDLQKVIDYGAERGIGVIVYVNRRALESQLDELLPLYKSWGIKGIKFGFVRTGSQQWTNWLHDAIRKAADYQLMVDVHDEYRSTGYERTYPNLMCVEGIGGDETSPTGETAIKNVFIRLLCGAADPGICYFDRRVDKISSHAAQLAKGVCFFSPWQWLYWYDTPVQSYAEIKDHQVISETPELEFWDHMPTIWDETRVLGGEIGEFVAIARRSGDQWFIGVMNNAHSRTIELSLDFLQPDSDYTAFHYFDDASVATPTRVGSRQQTVQSSTTISVKLQPNGGEAIRIAPMVGADK